MAETERTEFMYTYQAGKNIYLMEGEGNDNDTKTNITDEAYKILEAHLPFVTEKILRECSYQVTRTIMRQIGVF